MSPYKRLSIFDLDRTLIRGNTSMLFVRYLQRHFHLSLGTLFSSFGYFLQHRYMSLSLNDLHDRVFKSQLYSKPKSLFTESVSGFLTEILPQSLYIPSILELKRAQQMGNYTIILSNSPDFIVEPIARYLKVDRWLATKYSVDKEGLFDKIEFVCDGKAKAEVLRSLCRELNIDRRDTIAYSDSIYDLELLQISGKAVVVNPDRKLRLISREQKWQII